MTFEQDPPRLRTLTGELPRELSLVLGDTHADDATVAELVALEQRVNRALRESELARSRVRSARPPAKRGRIAAVVFTFALGAAAGVAGSSAVFFVLSPSSPAPQVTAASSHNAPQARHAAPVTPTEPTPAPELPVDDPTQPAPATRESARAPTKNPVAEPSTEPSNRPAPGSREEFALLARSQAALASNPGLALALTSDHERNFPNGALVQERELVAIDALLRLGRRAEAVGRAARFHQQFPTSVHGRRIDVLLGSGGSPNDVRR
ncbi:MAG TPA: hypothetical protein VER96_29675 [Polyangiaceae bacterium]|nr:hypothetical protein [Polyangiaceae bacterium]